MAVISLVFRYADLRQRQTLRRSDKKKGAKDPIHMVFAFAARQRLALAQVKVSENPTKSLSFPRCST